MSTSPVEITKCYCLGETWNCEII